MDKENGQRQQVWRITRKKKGEKNMLRISQLKLKINHTEEELLEEIIRKAHGQVPIKWNIVKKSIDARKKPDLFYSYTIDASFAGEKRLLHTRSSKERKNGWKETREITYHFPRRNMQKLAREQRPVVIGAGPAGLFAALVLAENGFSPIVFERGEAVLDREEKVETFFRKGILDEESNVQFGEGGAGTFSDGKLNTLVKDKTGRNRFVLEQFVRHGAPEEILWETKPHIGTDILKTVVASMRETICRQGGEVHFRTKVTDFLMDTTGEERKITGLRLETREEDGSRRVWEHSCGQVILAIGHSARDTFGVLDRQKILMTPKAFAIGVRVEHPAEMINRSQYGEKYAGLLPTASYKLTHQCKNGRGIYSFCMCPGGYVVNSSSENGRLCVNGMSNYDRAGRNSNSAIITTVTPEDFGGAHPLAGVEFQRKYEALAYAAGEGKIPLQLYGDFQEGKVSDGLGEIVPSTKGSWTFANLRNCLPEYVAESLLEGMKVFGQRIKGYDREDTVFTGVETRTSSPLRIERNAYGQANLGGLYPCGEGAGYAGGITSAAMDGIKIAEAVAANLVK